MSEIKRRDCKGRILRSGEVQRRDGKYMFRYTDINGNRRSVYSWKLVDTDKSPDGKRCGVSLRTLEKSINKDLEDGINIATADSLVVNDLYRIFMDLRKDLCETTRCVYRDLYNLHVREKIGNKKVKNIQFSDLQKLYTEMVTVDGLKISMVEKVQSILYQMFDMALHDNVLRVNPASNVVKTVKKIVSGEKTKRHALSEEQQSRMIDFVYKTNRFIRWRTLITVLFGTGMRIGEALGLRWCDCDFDKNMISINHAIIYKNGEDKSGYKYKITKPKTEAGYRTIPMFAAVRKALLREMNNTLRPESFTVDGYTDFIFINSLGHVYTPTAIFDAIQKITNEYNLEEKELAEKEKRDPCYLPKISAHILRHTFCTRYCENEKDIKVIQEVMGHKDFVTTMNVYNEATEDRKSASFKDIEGKIKLA